MRSWLRRKSPALLTVMLLVAVPLVFLACSVATWLPDSSGIVYIDGKGAVVLYDIKKAKRKEIAKIDILSGAATAAPDGKSIAVAKMRMVNKQVMLTVEHYDLKGKQTHTSREFALPIQDEQQMMGATIEMSSDNRHTVTFVEGAMSAVVYDLKEKKFQLIPKIMAIPSYSPAWPVRVQHIPPHGKGFLAVSEFLDNPPSLVYQEWGKAARQIDLPKGFEKLVNTSSLAQQGVGVLTLPVWKQNKLTASFLEGTLSLDVEQGKIVYAKNDATTKLVKHAMENKVTVIAELADGVLLQVRNQNEIEMFRPKEGILKLAKVKKQSPITVVPSPDRRSMVIHHTFGKGQHVEIVTIEGKRIKP